MFDRMMTEEGKFLFLEILMKPEIELSPNLRKYSSSNN